MFLRFSALLLSLFPLAQPVLYPGPPCPYINIIFAVHHLFNYSDDGESIPLNCQFTSTTVHDITPEKDRYFHTSHPHPKNLTYQMIHFHKSQENKWGIYKNVTCTLATQMTIQMTISIQSIIRNGYAVNTFKYIPEFSKNQKSKLETTDMKNNLQTQGLRTQAIKIGTTYLISYILRAMSNIYIYIYIHIHTHTQRQDLFQLIANFMPYTRYSSMFWLIYVATFRE